MIARIAELRDQLVLLAPECLISATLVFLLLMRLIPALNRWHRHAVALPPILAALGLVIWQWQTAFEGGSGGTLFSGMMKFDPFACLLRGYLLAFAALALLLGLLTKIPDTDDSADYATLLLGGTLGMMLLASSHHLLMVFLALEMASLPSYALAGFRKGERAGSEAALKYILYGSAASGVALYGISLIVAKFGGGSFEVLAKGIGELASTGAFDSTPLVGLALVFAAFAFKLSAVPLHFWCPDVFAGASAEVGAFLSVASKAAVLAAAMRILSTLNAGGFATTWLAPSILLVGGLTATLGNLAALGQSNLKRLLAYSTIAHAGYLILALAPMNGESTSAALFYLIGYFPANLAAFAAVAAIRNATGLETLDTVKGLLKRNPTLAIGLTLALLSLLGLPPFAGFGGKFQVFASLYRAGVDTGTHLYFWLVGIGVVNTVFGAAVYLRILKAMTLDEPDNPEPFRTPSLSLFVGALGIFGLLLGLAWNPILEVTARAADSLGK